MDMINKSNTNLGDHGLFTGGRQGKLVDLKYSRALNEKQAL